MGFIERHEVASTGPVTGTRRVSSGARRSPARRTPSGSCARCRWTSNAADGSTRAAPTPPSRSGPKSSWPCPGGSRRRPRKPTGATLTSTSSPASAPYRLGHPPADEIENWLNDEVAAGLASSSVHRHYRTLRRLLQVAVEKQRILGNPCDRVQPPRLVPREMVFLSWEEAVDLAEVMAERYRALIYLTVDSGMRWSELVGVRRARLDVRAHKVRVTEQLVRLKMGEWLRKEPKTPLAIRSITISSVTATCSPITLSAMPPGTGWFCVHEWRRTSDDLLQLLG